MEEKDNRSFDRKTIIGHIYSFISIPIAILSAFVFTADELFVLLSFIIFMLGFFWFFATLNKLTHPKEEYQPVVLITYIIYTIGGMVFDTGFHTDGRWMGSSIISSIIVYLFGIKNIYDLYRYQHIKSRTVNLMWGVALISIFSVWIFLPSGSAHYRVKRYMGRCNADIAAVKSASAMYNMDKNGYPKRIENLIPEYLDTNSWIQNRVTFTLLSDTEFVITCQAVDGCELMFDNRIGQIIERGKSCHD